MTNETMCKYKEMIKEKQQASSTALYLATGHPFLRHLRSIFYVLPQRASAPSGGSVEGRLFPSPYADSLALCSKATAWQRSGATCRLRSTLL